ncbi:MAG TPA: HAD hydrolase family protein, partial [Anaerolineaceae bacterium]
GDVILPLPVDPRYTVDIDTPNDWKRAEWLVRSGGLEMVFPGHQPRPIPERIELLVLDFDGVLTDNRVFVDQDGREMVAAYRSDSLGLGMLRAATGIEALVISKEVNPVVAARCKKMNIPYIQGIDDKPAALTRALAERRIPGERAVFIGNDLNDVPCFPLVGWAVVPADAQTGALRAADFVLSRKGGHGAVRELCELLMQETVEAGKP